jgi:hypothetical protein
MAYTAIAPQTATPAYNAEGGTDMATLTFTSGDATNSNLVTMTGRKILLLVTNTSGGASGTVTIASSDDPYGRTDEITTFTVADGAFAARWFEPVGWEQTLGGRDILITPSATTMEILAINA